MDTFEHLLLEQLTKPIENHSIQFFYNSNPSDLENRPISLGSGLLLRHKTNFYIVTAAHVVEDFEGKHIGVYTRTADFFELGSICKCIEADDPFKSTIDIAIWYIEPEIVADIAPFDWWYDVKECIINHVESAESKYYIFGFPAKKIDINESTKAIVQYPFKFFTRGYSTSAHVRNVHFNPKYNLLLEFHKKKIVDLATQRRQTAPDPYGISGCGLWFLDGLEYHLVGIMTEWKTPIERIPAFMATKIDYVIGAMEYLEKSMKK